MHGIDQQMDQDTGYASVPSPIDQLITQLFRQPRTFTQQNSKHSSLRQSTENYLQESFLISACFTNQQGNSGCGKARREIYFLRLMSTSTFLLMNGMNLRGEYSNHSIIRASDNFTAIGTSELLSSVLNPLILVAAHHVGTFTRPVGLA